MKLGERSLHKIHGSEYQNALSTIKATQEKLTDRFQHLDAHLVKLFRSPRTAILTHTSGGGTFEFLDRQCKDFSGTVFIFLDTSESHFRVSVGDYFLPALELFPIRLNHLSSVLKAFGVSEIEVHTGVTADTRLFYLQLHQYSGIKKFFLHDFSPFCARINLIGGLTDKPSYCGAPDKVETCEMCIQKHGSSIGPSSVRDLRATVRMVFSNSEEIYVPHKNSAEVWNAWGIQTEVVKHNLEKSQWGTGNTQRRLDAITVLDGSVSNLVSTLPRTLQGRPRILIPGRISYAKGADSVKEVLLLNRLYGSPLEFILCGEIDRNILSDMTLFSSVIGDYDKKLPHLAKEIDIDAVWLASIWPETYMYVLDDLWELPQKNFLYLNDNIGAPLERSKTTGFNKVVQVSIDPVQTITKMMNDLLQLKSESFSI